MAGKTRKFRAEMTQLLDIIIHSLYSNQEIFLRELISNAIDAIDRVRFEGLTNPNILENNTEWKIKLSVDKEAGLLTLSDNGIGMSAESIVENLGTIAKSGTQTFIESLKNAEAGARPELIGQFGVGFYSTFMVADRVTVVSRLAGDPSAGVRWESAGEGSYTIETVKKETRGTDVILHLRENAKEFLDEWRLREIVKKYSDFTEHPIVMEVEKAQPGHEGHDHEPLTERVEETLNSQKAIWLRPKSEIKDEEYAEFYKHLSHDFNGPLKTIHYVAEGQMEFKALLFLPAAKPPAFLMTDPTKQGPHLYIKRVFIMDDAESLLPPYLRFVRGVVDSADLPLNVSREMLQDNPLLTKINKALTNKILGTLEEMAKDEPEEYAKFFKEWGALLKMGIQTDFANRDRLAELLCFESTKTEPGKYTTLASYLSNMKEDQKEIYYLVGASREVLEKSPHLEIFRARDREVLLMTDPIDEWVADGLGAYKEKQFKAADKGEIEGETDEKDKKTAESKFKDFLDFLKGKIEEVKEVRLSGRLKESASVLVVDEGQLSPHMQTLLRSIGRDNLPNIERILEINPTHPTIEAIRALFEKNSADERLVMHARLLYEQALIAEGSKLADPLAFTARLNKLIAMDAKA